MKTVAKAVAIAAMVMASGAMAQGGGTLGGNVPADSGAVNVGMGKCTAYKVEVKKAEQAGQDTSTIVKPAGC